MKIGIIGAGNVGTGLGKRLAAKGHDIVVSFARSMDKVEEAAQIIGGGARAGTREEATAHGEVVIVATPWGATLEALTPVADALTGKVVTCAKSPTMRKRRLQSGRFLRLRGERTPEMG